ncbi:MAG: DUF4097 family beta strand repeat-containing protein [Thermoanaerobaculia bacterium]
MKRAITLIAAILIALPLAAASRELKVSPGQLLEIDLNQHGAIEITGTDRNVVAVDSSKEVEISQSSRGVRVESNLMKGGGKMTLRVEVPRKFDVTIDTLGGGITINNVEGEIRGKTMGGKLTLGNLRGTLNLTTMGGNIELRDSVVEGSVETMGGQVLLKNVAGGVKGSSMGGNVIYDNVKGPEGSTGKAVVISTMGGRIDVAAAPHGADVKTMGGAIEIKEAAEFVKASTMGGDIRVGGVAGSAKASTMGGDVDVTILPGGPRDKDVDLSSMGGRITLTLPAGYSASFDVEITYTKNSSRKYEIKSDFPMQITETPDWNYRAGAPRKFIRGTSTSGAHTVKIRTVNGDVVIRKR